MATWISAEGVSSTMVRIKHIIKISFVNALRGLIHTDVAKWHLSPKFNCWVAARRYFYIGTLLTKTTFLLKLRVPAVPANEAYMCKALLSVQLNCYRTTGKKKFQIQSKRRILQKAGRQSVFLPLTNTINNGKSFHAQGKRLYLRPVLTWALLLNLELGTPAPSYGAAALKKGFLENSS